MSSGQVLRDMPYAPYAIPANQTEANAEFSTNLGLMFISAYQAPRVAAYEGFAARNIQKASVQTIIDEAAVHGNSLNSMKPTWGYRLFSNDGTFLKNGITSAARAESRYSKSFMSDKFMKAEMFPNRRAAYNWEYNQNMTNPGPLNKERYLIKTNR